MAADAIYEQVGRLIKTARLDAKMTQEQLGISIGLTRTSVNNIEHGRQPIQIHTLFAIASTVGVEPSTLLPDAHTAPTAGVDDRIPKRLRKEDRDWLAKVLTIRQQG
jgi:transcriptional regulator with XRE-family HTH domain